MQRFFDKINKSEDGCWLWTAGGRGTGYGAIKYNGKIVDAHRVSWILHFGEIPEGMFICHKCDVRKCVNPDHLFIGTHKDNMQDCIKKGRFVRSEISQFKNGNKPPNRHYSELFIKLILDGIKNKGELSLKNLSEMYGVSYQFIRDLNTGRTFSALSPVK